MTLKDKLAEDLKVAMREKNTNLKSVVTLIRSAVKQREVDERVELADDDIIDLIAKQLKQRKDALTDFEKAGREDLIIQTNSEIDILCSYLPQQLSDKELEKIVAKVIANVGAQSMKDMGKIMGKVMPEVKGRADGKRINEIAKIILG
ncbi:MAG: GatB/YqeY domain-containing protein [Filifactoraceae bacterium]